MSQHWFDVHAKVDGVQLVVHHREEAGQPLGFEEAIHREVKTEKIDLSRNETLELVADLAIALRR